MLEVRELFRAERKGESEKEVGKERSRKVSHKGQKQAITVKLVIPLGAEQSQL